MSTLQHAVKRGSCRDYQNKALKSEDLAFVQSCIEKYHRPQLQLTLINEGEDFAKAVQGAAGYNGHMIQAPHYIALLATDHHEPQIRAGYVGERILFDLLDKRIANCWVSVEDTAKVDAAIKGRQENYHCVALLALGYAASDSFFSKLFGGKKKANRDYKEVGYGDITFDRLENAAARKATTEFVYLDRWGNASTMEELKQRGFDIVYRFMRLAPSYGNRQPWKFILTGTELMLCTEKSKDIPEVSSNLDTGIMMVYIEEGMDQLGYQGKWNLDVKPMDISEDYRFMATYELKR